MSVLEHVLVAVCVLSCVLSAGVLYALDTHRLSRQQVARIAGWQLLITGSITVYFVGQSVWIALRLIAS